MATVTRTSLTTDIASYRQQVKDFGTCLHFDGTEGSIDLGTANPFTGSFYFSAWVKWYGSNGTYQHLFAKRDSYGASTMMFDFHINNTTNELNLDTNAAQKDFDYILPLYKWTHVVWVHNATTNFERLYIDGELVKEISIATLGTGTTAKILIGAVDTTTTEWFNGRIDEVAIGTTAPSWDDVVAMYAKYNYPSKWSHLQLDEGSGTSAIDSSGNGNNGTIADATYVTDKVLTARSTVTDRFLIRNIGKSAYFTASAGKLTVPITPSLTNFNFGIWFNRRNQGNFAHLVSWVNASGTTHGFTLSTVSTGLNLTMYNNGSTTANINTSLNVPLIGWNHVAVTFATNNLKIYLNGTLVGSDTSCSMDTTNPAQTLTIGKRSDSSGNQIMAYCDFVWVNATPWTQQQVTDLYYRGAVPQTPDVYYKLNENTGTTAIDYSGNGNNGTYSSVAWLSEAPNHLFQPRTVV